MRLADFILANIEPILLGWESFARSMGAGEHLDQLTLRDHAAQILQATARDMKSPQTAAEIAALQHEVATLKRTVAALQRDYARHAHTYAGADGEQHQTSGPVAKAEH